MKPLIVGLLLSPVLVAGWFFLAPEKKNHETSSAVTERLSLADINFALTKPAKQVPDAPLLVYPSAPVAGESVQTASKTIKDFKGKPIILHFWATWCGPCVEEMPHFDVFAQNHGDAAHILAVTTEKAGVVPIREFYAKHGITALTVCLDDNGRLATLMGVQALPTTVFVNAVGEETGRISGMVDWKGAAQQTILAYLEKIAK